MTHEERPEIMASYLLIDKNILWLHKQIAHRAKHKFIAISFIVWSMND